MKKDRPRITDKSPNELPGVRKRSFILPFAGGEIWFEHLDGIYQYTPLAVQKLRADTAAFRRPSAPGYIAFVLDETVITEELISAITDALTGPGKRFMRVAFVGTDGASDRKLKKLLYGHGFAIGSFDGIEPAKDWLLDEQRSKKKKGRADDVIRSTNAADRRYRSAAAPDRGIRLFGVCRAGRPVCARSLSQICSFPGRRIIFARKYLFSAFGRANGRSGQVGQAIPHRPHRLQR